jgi:hypothetical protein
MRFNSRVSVHEAGHCVVALVLGIVVAEVRVILPRGQRPSVRSVRASSGSSPPCWRSRRSAASPSTTLSIEFGRAAGLGRRAPLKHTR